MVQQVAQLVLNRIRQDAMLEPGDAVVVGCSGGADSTCLLHLLASGTLGIDVRCKAVYVDHGLRADTAADRAAVEALAGRLGVPFEVVEVDVKDFMKRSGEASVQSAARALRYQALRHALEEHAGPGARGRIAVGHTLNDQAETVLLQLVRGAGLRGLAGIPPVRDRIIRPLLDVSRRQVEAYCRAHGLAWVEDPSNAGVRYRRNRVRRDVLPLLREINARVDEHLARTARILRDEDAFLDELALRALESIQVVDPAPPVAPAQASGGGSGECVRLSASGLAAQPRALARRIVRLAAERCAGGEAPLHFEHVEAILALAHGSEGTAEFRGAGPLVVRREYDVMTFWLEADESGNVGEVESEAPGEAVNGAAVEAGGEGADGLTLDLPGEVRVPGSRIRVEAQTLEAPVVPQGSNWEAWLDLDALQLPLTARTKRPGDRVQPLGMSGRKKVSDILVDAKVPRRCRAQVVVVCDALGPVWVAGHATDERAKVTPKTRRVVHLKARWE